MDNMEWLILAAIGAFLLLFSKQASGAVNSVVNTAEDFSGSILGPSSRGERNNNPGNIANNPAYKWDGQTGVDQGGYLIFSDAVYGIRAMARDLTNKFNRGLKTISDIIMQYAPPSENPTAAYIQFIADQFGGIDPYGPIDLSNPATLKQFVTAMIRFENGRVIYDDQTITNGVVAGMSQ
jgi:hypothetical protein